MNTIVANLMGTYAKLRMARLDGVADRLIELVNGFAPDATLGSADLLRLMGSLVAAFPEHADTITAMFVNPF